MHRKVAATIAAVAAVSFFAATIPAEAQDRARTRITIQKRSYLDPGTKVKPGYSRDHDYAFPPEARFPSYGPYPAGSGSYGSSRWPLLGQFEGPFGY
jgi:hypothetical protein